MSQPPPPPSGKRTAGSPPPLPKRTVAPALPVQAVEPLEYATGSSEPARPGILVAIAVVGLIAGILSLLANGWTGWFWLSAYSGSVPPPPPAQPGPLAVVVLPRYTGETVGARGLPRAQRSPIVAAAPLTGPFAVDRRDMLDRFLSEYGRDVVDGSGGWALRPIAAPQGQDERRGAWSSAFYQSPSGRVQVGNLFVELERDQAHGGALRVDRNAATGGGRSLRYQSMVIDQPIAAFRQRNPSMTRGHADFIASQFGAWNERQNRTTEETCPVEVRSIDEHGVALVAIGTEQHWVLADGRSASVASVPQGLDGATGRPWPPIPPPFTAAVPGSPSWMLANASHALAGLLLGCFLILAAVRTLMHAASGARLLLWFACLKSALVIIELIVCIGFFVSVSAASGAMSMRPGAAPARGGYSLSRGTLGLALSVTFQSALIAAIFFTLYTSAAVRRYLAQHGGLSLLSAQYRGSLLAVRRRPLVRRILQTAGLLMMVLAIAHVVWPIVWRRGDIAAHVLAGGLAAGLALLCLTMARVRGSALEAEPARAPGGARSVLTPVLIAAGLIGLGDRRSYGQAAAGATPPAATASAPVDAATQSRIDAIVGEIERPNGNTDRNKLMAELAAMGAPAEATVLKILERGHFSNVPFIEAVVGEWGRSRLLADPACLAAAMKMLPRLKGAEDTRGVVLFLSAFVEAGPEIAAAYAGLDADRLPEVRETVVKRSIAIDKAATLLAHAEQRIRAGRMNAKIRSCLCDTLHRVGAPAMPLLMELSRSADLGDRASALDAMMPDQARDQTRYTPGSESRARDSFGHSIDGTAGAAPLVRLDDPDLAAELVLRCREMLVELGATMTGNDSVKKGEAEQLGRTIAHTLTRGGASGRKAVVEALAGKGAKGAAIPVAIRVLVARELARMFPALDGLGFDNSAPAPESRWPSIASAVEAVIQDPDHAPTTLVALLGSGQADNARAAADVLANIGLSDAAQIAPVSKAFATADPDVRKLLTTAVFKGSLSSDARIKDIARELALSTSDGPGHGEVLRRLGAAVPHGRRALAEALADPRAVQPAARQILEALGPAAPVSAGLARAGQRLNDLSFRRAVSQLLLTYLDDPDRAVAQNIAQLDAADETSRCVAAYALEAFMARGELGMVTAHAVRTTLGTPERKPYWPPVQAARSGTPPAASAGAPAALWFGTWAALALVACGLLGLLAMGRMVAA